MYKHGVYTMVQIKTYLLSWKFQLNKYDVLLVHGSQIQSGIVNRLLYFYIALVGMVVPIQVIDVTLTNIDGITLF